jgi:predicted phage-related endonuclease
MKYEWVTEIEDRTPEWFEYRNNGLGASTAAIVCGLSPYKPTPMQLFHEKVGTMEPDRTMSAPASWLVCGLTTMEQRKGI